MGAGAVTTRTETYPIGQLFHLLGCPILHEDQHRSPTKSGHQASKQLISIKVFAGQLEADGPEYKQTTK